MKKDIVGAGYYLLLACICFFFGFTGSPQSDISLLSPLIGIFIIGIGCALMFPEVTGRVYSAHTSNIIIALIVVLFLIGAFSYSLLKILESSGFQALSQIFDPFSIGLFIVSFFMTVNSLIPGGLGKGIAQFFDMQSRLLNMAISSFVVWLIFAMVIVFFLQVGQSRIFLPLGFVYIVVAIFSYNNWFVDCLIGKQLLD